MAHKKETLLKTSEGMARFRALLKENGFIPKEPNLKTGWDVFRKFAGLQFDCADDSLLFEAGVYEYTDETLFCLSMVRQFTIEVDGEYDYIEQIHLDLFYKPDGTLGGLKETLWTCDFDDDASAFFKAVEESASFKIPFERYQPMSCDIYQDEI